MSCLLLAIPVAVVLGGGQGPVTDHIHDAWRQGKPRVLHIDRAHADAHRRAALRGIPTRAGFDRDEYPPAATEEGGAGADVRLVPSAANRSAGSIQGRDLAAFCDHQAFIFISRR